MEHLVFGLISGLVLGIPLGAVGLVKLQRRQPETPYRPTTQPSLEPLSYAPAGSQFHGEFRPTESASVPVM